VQPAIFNPPLLVTKRNSHVTPPLPSLNEITSLSAPPP